MLNALGDHDLALPVEQGDGGHFPEVKVRRISYFIRSERIKFNIPAFSILSYRFVLKIPFAIDNLDAGRAKKGKDTVEFIGAVNPFGQAVVYFVIEKIASLFSQKDQLSDFFMPVFN
jgi:hypothetical protein